MNDLTPVTSALIAIVKHNGDGDLIALLESCLTVTTPRTKTRSFVEIRGLKDTDAKPRTVSWNLSHLYITIDYMYILFEKE